MEEEPEHLDAVVKSDDLDRFQLPYPVATLEALEQRAYLTPEGTPEWLFSTPYNFCQIAQPAGKLLRQNLEKIHDIMMTLQIPVDQLHFRGADVSTEAERPWKDHTMETSAFLATLLWIMRNRSLKAYNKLKACELLLGLASHAFSSMDFQRPLQGMLTTSQGVLVSHELFFSPQQLCPMWGAFLRKCPGAVALWTMLGHRCWLNRCIASSIDNAHFTDVWFFMAYIWCHPKLKKAGQIIYLCFGQSFLCELLEKTATGLAALAVAKSKEALRMLPILKTKHGNARKLADPVNKILLLYKLRKEKLHRQRVASTHEELGGGTNRMIVFEHYLDCLMHMQALQRDFSGLKQISVTWDPSTYGGKDVLMSIAYSPVKDQAAYLLSQHLSHTVISELDLSLVPLAQKKKLKRLDGFKEVKGLSCALGSIGLSLMDFQVPQGLVCRPLKACEFRVKQPDGKWYVYNEESDTIVPEIPPGLDLGSIPCLLSISDQGPFNLAALNFLALSSESLLIWPGFDPYHRAWNDLKLALKRSRPSAWRTVLEMTLVANINYGPFSSSAWFFKKKAKLQEFLDTNTASSPAWQAYQHLICQEKRIQEPSSELASEELFATLQDMDSFVQKGPLIKLMRWFSFFESMVFHQGTFWATRMILEESQGLEIGSDKEVEEPIKENADHQRELQALKKRKGTWKLAPTLITSRSLCIKDIILCVGKASWQCFSSMARSLLSPMQVLQHNIACAQSGFWLQEIMEMLFTSLCDKRHLQHLLPEYKGHPDALVWHCDVLNKLLETRSMSLASFHCLPPNLYSHALAPSPALAKPAFDLAVNHFQILLEAEGAANAGARVEPLESMHWRHSPLLRVLLMAYEQDSSMGIFGGERSSAVKLQTVLSKHLGDSRVIENVHQHGRDIFRNSKANSISNTAIMAHALRSGVLEQRNVKCVSAQNAATAKATGSAWQQKFKEPVVGSLRTHGKKLPASLQKMMLPKTDWPSPNPASMFSSLASTQWLFRFWTEKHGAFAGHDVNAAWLSFLARPGSLVASRSKGRVIKVLSSAEFGFLGIFMQVTRAADGASLFTCSRRREDAHRHHICSLDDWLCLEMEPCLMNGDGTLPPLAWRQNADPLSLEAAALIHGSTITFQQAKKLLDHLGAPKVRGNASKQTVMQALVEFVLPEEQREAAMKHYTKDVPQEEMDSDFSEINSELGQDDGNVQDLKQYKEKKRTYKLRKKLAEEPEPEAGPKRRPKAKAKSKAKAKAKAKAKMSFGQALVNRAKKLRQEREADEKKDGMPEERQVLPPAPEAPVPAEHPDDAPPSPGGPASSSRPAPPAAPASPSGVAPPSPGAPASEGPPVKKQRATPVAVAADRGRSPEEWLSSIAPPGCKFGVSFKDHRWTSRWEEEHPQLDAPFSQTTFTTSFAQKKKWVECLQEVHKHNWTKWQLVKAYHPLEEGQVEQVPGEVPAHVLAALKPTVDGLGEVVRYPRSGKKTS